MTLLFILAFTVGAYFYGMCVTAFLAAGAFISINSAWADSKKINTLLLVVGILASLLTFYLGFQAAHA